MDGRAREARKRAAAEGKSGEGSTDGDAAKSAEAKKAAVVKAALDAKASPTLPVDSREAMLLASDGNSMEGRWFWGGYQEFGLDVKLARLDKQMTVLGVDKYALRSPSVETLHVYGGALPTSLAAAAISRREAPLSMVKRFPESVSRRRID